jgi:AbrB family looped-hinge helix DNA binding protein
MTASGTTRLSARGQVVIPEAIRASLGLTPGTNFVVVAEDDVVVLKRLDPPCIREFDSIVGRLRMQVRRSAMRPGDVREAVGRVRRRS